VIGKPKNLRHCVVTGGMEMIVQARELSNKPHIVVATPGRYLHIHIYIPAHKRMTLICALILTVVNDAS